MTANSAHPVAVPDKAGQALVCFNAGKASGYWKKILPIAPLSVLYFYQHYVDRQLTPGADGILGFVSSSLSTLTEKQIGLFQ